MMYERYYGQFKDNQQILYNVELWQESDTAFTIEEIEFQKEAVKIEWSKKDKLDPIRISGATINLLSQSDRKFVDLYTVKIGTVRLDIYRSGLLYWSGTISTEEYEEPFYTPKGYVVSLVFSDFNILDRIKYSLTGFKTINEIINYCLTSAGIQYTSIVRRISTYLDSTDTNDIFDETSVLSDNFYDEDGEADTLKTVLEYILKPFCVHIEQKNGNIYLYDINALMADTAEQIAWKAKDSSLTVDKVYNNAKITFSAYEKTAIMDAKMDEDDWDEDLIGDSSGILITVDRNDSTQGFRIKFGTDKTDKFILSNADAKFFLMKPIYSGSEDRGIMYCCIPDSTQYGHTATSCMSSGSISTTELFKVNDKPYMGYVSYRRMNYKLKIILNLMFDVRYNPFEEKGLGNEEGNYARMQDWCNFAYIPVMITLRDADGNALYHYKNNGCIGSTAYAVTGAWVAGEAAWGDAYLCYYDESNRTSSTGLGGWSANRQTIGYYAGDLPKNYSKRGEGEFMDLPPAAGWLDVRVGTGIYQLDHDNYEEKDILSRCRWMMYKDITIDLVDKYGNKISLKDQVHKAWINRNAEDAYEVDTHVGTMANAAPTARGVLFNTSTKYIITELYRNGITAAIEKLMIGTIYSQFAARKNKLTGTVRLLPSFSILSDKNITGKYMLTYEMQSLAVATSEINMIEIESDNYQGVEFTE